MKRIIYIFFIAAFACGVTSLSAQTDSVASFESKSALANEMYKQGQYSDAAQLYEEMLSEGAAAELYYNLGNSYYKAGEIGLAILNYERALRINPRLKDASYNLEIAESKIVDKVNSTPTFFVKRWVGGLIRGLTSNHWAIISIVFFVAMLASFLFFLFSSERSKRKVSFYGTVVLALLFITTFVFSGVNKDQFVKHNKAVILSGSVTAKSAPDVSGTDLFQLHEGTRVNVKSSLGVWSEISLENGAVGWIEDNNLERI